MSKVIIRVLGGISPDCFRLGIDEAKIVELTSNKTSNDIYDLCLKALGPNTGGEKIDVLEIPDMG